MSPPAVEDTIAHALQQQGWAVIPEFVAADEVAQLAHEVRAMRDAGLLHRAGIGKGAELSVNDAIRGDFISWLGDDNARPMQQAYLARLEALRHYLNQALFLGLFDVEAQAAIYPPGAYYRKHLDQFQQDSLRTLSGVLYLNPRWQPGDGGELRLYLDADGRHLDIAPSAGTLVLFLSARFWHEVLPTARERLSITSWFRRRDARPLALG